jgi:hypothetical protein
MTCSLDLLSDSLQNSLIDSQKLLFEVGETKSISTFELSITSWVMAFYVFSESEISHSNPVIAGLDADNIEKITNFTNEQVMNSAQIVFDMVNEDVNQGILIPRIRGHIFTAVNKLLIDFQDHVDIILISRSCVKDDCFATLSNSESEEMIDWIIRFSNALDTTILKSLQGNNDDNGVK